MSFARQKGESFAVYLSENQKSAEGNKFWLERIGTDRIIYNRDRKDQVLWRTSF